MPWKDAEKRREARRKKYQEMKASGQSRDWGKIEAVCPVCNDSRWISKNQHGITTLPCDEQGRIVRRCRACSKTKEFAPSYTAVYMRDRATALRIAQKREAIHALGGACMDCGLAYDGANGYGFDFHHRDPATKSFNIGSKHVAPERLRAEIAKCDLLCAICHRKRHSMSF